MVDLDHLFQNEPKDFEEYQATWNAVVAVRDGIVDFKKKKSKDSYSVFRTLIGIAALSSPSTSLVKDPNRAKIIAEFESLAASRRFDCGPGSLSI